MKKTEPMLFDDVLRQMIEASGMRPKMQAYAIENAWSGVVGDYIASFTGRRYVKDRVFHVYVVSAPMKEQLSYMRDALVKALNEAAGEDVIDAIIIH